MSGHVHQHFLPCAYLRHFSIDGQRSSRDSLIWRTDLNEHKLHSVESQCSKPFFYSREDAERVEAEFGKLESFYGQIVGKFWREENPKRLDEYFGLLVMMLDLHIRNARYAVSSEENYEHYLSRTAAVRNQILFGDRGGPSTDKEIVDLWKQHWRVRIVQAPKGRSFLTSDNPSLWLNANDRFGDVHLVLLPVMPRAYAVAYDNRVFDFVAGTTTEKDEAILNQLQIRQCVEAVFTDEQLTDDQLSGARKRLAQPKSAADINRDGSWMPDILRVPDSDALSFVRSLHGIHTLTCAVP